MRRHWESMNNDKKIRGYWTGTALRSLSDLDDRFYHHSAALIFWYGITTKNGNLTLANITAIMSRITGRPYGCPLDCLLSVQSSVWSWHILLHDPSRKRQLCQRLYCIYLHPSYVDELPAAHYGMADIT